MAPIKLNTQIDQYLQWPEKHRQVSHDLALIYKWSHIKDAAAGACLISCLVQVVHYHMHGLLK